MSEADTLSARIDRLEMRLTFQDAMIEDLNETGFADPRRLSRDDLPLIVSRLELIEQLAPDAMDELNADAFAEAYKDLQNMYKKVTGE